MENEEDKIMLYVKRKKPKAYLKEVLMILKNLLEHNKKEKNNGKCIKSKCESY